MILALDVGTSSARASLYDEAGARVPGGEHRIPCEPRTTPDGGVEHEAAALLETVAACIDAVLPRAGEIDGVGVTTFWHGLLGFDPAGRPVTPVLSWADTRSARVVDELRRRLDERAVHARTGCPLHTSYWPAKIRWLSAAAPTVARWGSIGELLSQEWFGDPATSVSMASATGLFDQRAAGWDPEMLEVAGIDERFLFPVRDRTEPWRGLREPWASRWPALLRAAWFPAVGDGAASNVGSGATGPDRIAINVGTSAAMRLCTGAQPETPAGLWCYRVDRGLSVVGGATSEGGNVFAWCADTLRLPDRGQVEAALARAVAQDRGLGVLPFLAGERSPGWNGRARAAIAGLSLDTTPIDILHAALQSVAFRLGLIYARLRPLAAEGHEIVVSGGALAGSPSWAQMVADVLGWPLTLARESEVTSRGAALLALDALGALPTLAGIRPPAGDRIAPRPEQARRHAAAFERHVRLYDALLAGPGAPGLAE